MKKGDIINVFVFILILTLSISSVSAGIVSGGPECSDGIDNDNDGLIDAQKTLLENTDTLKLGTNWERTDNPIILTESVAKEIINKKLSYTPTYSNFGEWASAMTLGSSISSPDTVTLTKICNVMGFRTYTNDFSCSSPYYLDDDGNKLCNFKSPDDIVSPNNRLWKYQSNDFISTSAQGNVWLSKLICIDRIPACSDGWDNDKEGNIDASDDGCRDFITGNYNPNFDSENPDPDCYNAEDTNEKTAPECSDGWDNDNDRLVDLNDNGCSNIDDNDELVEKQCNDDVDNDNDRECDYDGCSINGEVLRADPGCKDENDDLENTPECSDGNDNDNDGKIDYKTDGTGDPGCLNLNDESEDNEISISKAFWGNSYSAPISEADRADRVTLNIIGKNLNGLMATYEIYKDNGDGRLDASEKINNFGLLYNKRVSAIWIAGKHTNGDSLGGNYYFKAKIDNKEITSDLLIVKDDIKNDLPIIRIINPEDKQIYFSDKEIYFRIYYEDPDDYSLRIRIDSAGPPFQRDYSELVNSKGVIELPIKYLDSSPYIPLETEIYVTAYEYRDPVRISVKTISILIVNPDIERKYGFSYFNPPIYSFFYPSGSVRLSAINSYFIESKIDNGIISIKCLNGLCPSETKGCPPGRGDLPGCRIPVSDYPTTPNNANYDRMSFKWGFEQLIINPDGTSFTSGYSCDNVIGNTINQKNKNDELCGVGFNKIFDEGHYTLNLIASLKDEEAMKNEMFRYFSVVPSEGLSCKIAEFNNQFPDAIAGNSYWISTNGIEDSFNNCYDEEGITQTCCPNSYRCNEAKDKCETIFIDDCQDYSDKTSCEKDEYSVARPSTGLECGEKEFGICMKKENCICKWNDGTKCSGYSSTIYYIDHNHNNKIDDGEEVSVNIENRCHPPNDEVITNCEYTHIPEGDCNIDGTKTIKHIPNDLIRCPDIEPTIYKCSNLARLGFFSWWNVFLVILVLFIIYFFHSLYK